MVVAVVCNFPLLVDGCRVAGCGSRLFAGVLFAGVFNVVGSRAVLVGCVVGWLVVVDVCK